MPDAREIPDGGLVARVASGDLVAFDVLYDRYQHVVYRFARAMTGSHDAAEDITQEVFVALFTDAERYDERRAAFSTYLYGMVRNLSRARLRKDRRLSLPGASSLTIESERDDPQVEIERAELAALVRRALLRIPSRYRELILLCDLHGLSYQEAAAVVESSVGAVRSRLHRGRQLLKLRMTGALTRPSRRSQPRVPTAIGCAT